jgi:hypothetical protein
MAVAIKDLQERRKAAALERDLFRPLLDEAFEFAIPYRKSSALTGKAEKRTNRIFDHTAIISTFRSASRLAQDISPPGQQNIALMPGALARATLPANELEAMKTQLEVMQIILNALFMTGEWDQALTEMCTDLMAGTGCMLIVKGDPEKRPVRFVTVPLDEIMLSSGPYNDIDGIFWERKWTLRALAMEFTEAAFTDELQKMLKDTPEAEICLYQDTVWEPDGKKWCRTAWVKENVQAGGKGEPKALEVSYSLTCPWLTPRYFRVSGETYGRGTIMLVLPTVKALNTATKINLQAAAIAMLGIYTAVDDGVFSPDMSPLTPGAFWKVARNGGALGPSVMRFPDPRIDLSQIVLKELRMDVQSGMNDQSLPPDGAAVRSATEIMERVKRLASDHQGAYGRLIMEIIVPAARRVMEIAYDLKIIQQTIPIDRLLVDLQVASPLAMAREAEALQKVTEYMQLAMMVSPQQPGRYVKLDEVLPEIAMKLSIPSRFVPNDEERKAMDEQAAAAQVMAAAGAVAGQDPQALQQALGQAA